MIRNLFSIFDPSSSINNNSNWMSVIIIFIVLPQTIWLTPNNFYLSVHKVITVLHLELKILLGNSSFKGSSIIFITIFFIVLTNNFFGLFSYIFTCSRHLTITISFALPLWVSFIILGWFNFTKHIFAHLVPQGTPTLLISFIVLIESVRNIIRPGTLAVRLTANIIAGHLLITLLGNQTASSSFLLTFILLFIQILLLLLETGVAIIQAYVITVLSTLYSSETTQH